MTKKVSTGRKMEMYQAILNLQDLDECCAFFEDLCAITELGVMEQRFEVARMLKQNKVYTEIMQATSASSATISRVNRMLQYGTGCLGRIIEQMEQADTDRDGRADNQDTNKEEKGI